MDAVEAEIRRLVDRGPSNLREDARAFGVGQDEREWPPIPRTACG